MKQSAYGRTSCQSGTPRFYNQDANYYTGWLVACTVMDITKTLTLSMINE